MRDLRASLLAVTLAALPALAVFTVPSDAHASVSIAIGFDDLVKGSDAVAVMTPTESKTVWEDGRIITYTHLTVDQGVAGALGTGADGWVRTLGGVVGKIGQMVDGEPVFTFGKSSMLFLRRYKSTGTWEVSARAQGQYPVVLADDAAKTRKVIRSNHAGMLYQPKENLAAAAQSNSATATSSVKPPIRLASDVIHDRPVDDVARDVATSWRTLHTQTTTDPTK